MPLKCRNTVSSCEHWSTLILPGAAGKRSTEQWNHRKGDQSNFNIGVQAEFMQRVLVAGIIMYSIGERVLVR